MSRKRSAAKRATDANGRDEAAEKRRALQEWEREQVERQHRRDESRRALCDGFHIWMICPHKNCRRARRCCGDTSECMTQRWHRYVPEETRNFVAKFIQLSHEGLSPTEALEATKAAIKEREAIIAQFRAGAPPRPRRSRDDEP